MLLVNLENRLCPRWQNPGEIEIQAIGGVTAFLGSGKWTERFGMGVDLELHFHHIPISLRDLIVKCTVFISQVPQLLDEFFEKLRAVRLLRLRWGVRYLGDRLGQDNRLRGSADGR